MNALIQFVLAHQTPIALFLAWNFSAALSSMPPISDKAGWFAHWLYDYAQLIAANLNKRTEAQKGPAAPSPLPKENP